MKKIVILITMMISLISIACQSNTWVAKSKVNSTHTDPELIKEATVLIVVKKITKVDTTMTFGMATLVKIQGHDYLVTHNHYSDLLRDRNVIEIRDAKNNILQEMYVAELKSLVVYQDAGTMVLRAPGGLSDKRTAASLDAMSQLKPGDTVQVAHRKQPTRDAVVVLDAVVEDIRMSDGAPVYTLRTLDGESIYPGDSGGGVWYEGKLVANTWAAVTTHVARGSDDTIDPDSEILTDKSRAAILPEQFK